MGWWVGGVAYRRFLGRGRGVAFPKPGTAKLLANRLPLPPRISAICCQADGHRACNFKGVEKFSSSKQEARGQPVVPGWPRGLALMALSLISMAEQSMGASNKRISGPLQLPSCHG